MSRRPGLQPIDDEATDAQLPEEADGWRPPTFPDEDPQPPAAAPARRGPGRPRGSRTRDRVDPPRLSLTLNADETIKWEAVKPETVAKLARSLRRPEAQAALGFTPAAAPDAAMQLPAELAATLYDALSLVNVMIAQKVYGFTQEESRPLVFTREHKQLLGEPTAAVLNKHLTALNRYPEETAWGALLVTIYAQMISQLQRTPVTDYRAPLGVNPLQ